MRCPFQHPVFGAPPLPPAEEVAFRTGAQKSQTGARCPGFSRKGWRHSDSGLQGIRGRPIELYYTAKNGASVCVQFLLLQLILNANLFIYVFYIKTYNKSPKCSGGSK